MTTATPDAVDVLEYAMLEATGGYTKGAAKAAVDFLELEGFAITRAEPAPVGFDAAIKQLGEPDVATGHWSLDEGNLRWFVGQCRAEPTPKVEIPDGFKYTPAQQAVWDWWCEHQKAPPVCDDLNNLVWQLEKLKSAPAMSEAELLLHCQSLAMEFADDNLRKDCEQAAFELAKKYRGS